MKKLEIKVERNGDKVTMTFNPSFGGTLLYLEDGVSFTFHIEGELRSILRAKKQGVSVIIKPEKH